MPAAVRVLQFMPFLFCCSHFVLWGAWWSESSLVAAAPERHYSSTGLFKDLTPGIQCLIVLSAWVVLWPWEFTSCFLKTFSHESLFTLFSKGSPCCPTGGFFFNGHSAEERTCEDSGLIASFCLLFILPFVHLLHTWPIKDCFAFTWLQVLCVWVQITTTT